MKRTFIDDNEAEQIFKKIEMEVKATSLISDNDDSIIELRFEYEKLKRSIEEFHRIFNLQTTSGGDFFQKFLKHVVGTIATRSLSAKTNDSKQKITSSLADAESELEYIRCSLNRYL